MLNKKFSLKRTLLICGAVIILVGCFVVIRSLPRSSSPGTNAELGYYENKSLHLSFQYPKSFFVREETQDGKSVISLSPLANDNKLTQSSTGIAETFIIEFYPSESIDTGSPLQTQASQNAGFHEEPALVSGIGSIHQSYNNAYSGDQNEIWLIPCNTGNKGVFSIGFMDSPLTAQYRSVVESLKICK